MDIADERASQAHAPCQGSRKGQYRSNKENLRKSQVRESEVEMMRTFTAEARTDAFDDAAIETQTAWCKQRPLHHQRSVQIRHHGVKQQRGCLNTQDGRITEGLHTEDETDAVRIERRGTLGPTKHHHPDGIMGQPKGRKPLDNKEPQPASPWTPV